MTDYDDTRESLGVASGHQVLEAVEDALRVDDGSGAAVTAIEAHTAGAQVSPLLRDVGVNSRGGAALYGKGSGIVAVKLAITESTLRIFLGSVKYLDWNLASWDNNSLAMCFRKDSSYQHEAEVRAIIWDQDIVARNMSDALVAARSRSDYPSSGLDPFILRKEDGQHGIELPFAPERFITEVVIGPRERRWVATLVDSVLKRYGLKIGMTISNRLTPR